MFNLSSTHTVADQVGMQATSFSTGASACRYWVIIAVLADLATSFIAGLLAWDNPLPFGVDGLWPIACRRLDVVTAMVAVACCHAVATVALQSIANNRIITPSIMGFEAPYVVISTVAVHFFGATGLMTANSVEAFVLQLVLMMGLSLVLYARLLARQGTDMHSMLLVGIVIGGGLASLSTFMQRVLMPLDFDLLTARLFGSVDSADLEFFPMAIPLVIAAIVVIVLHSWTLNTVSLGHEVATNPDVSYQVRPITALVAVVVLMAVSTAMVSPMAFLGFLVATIAHQAVDTYDHRFVLPMAVLIGYVTPTSTYFILNHVSYAQGVVSIIVELVGGSTFLYVVLKKGRL